MRAGARADRPSVFRRFARNRRGLVGGVVVATMVTAGALAPMLAPQSYSAQSLLNRLKPPSATHWLGTDGFGRDVLSRLIWGSRVSLEIGLCATALSLVVGTAVGSIAGYFGGAADTAIMRAADVFLSVPALFLILIVVALFGASLANTALVIALVHLGAGRAHRAQRVPEPSQPRLRPRGRGARRRPRAHPRAPLARERPAHRDRPGQSPARPDDPDRIGPELPRARRPAAATELGQHGRRGPAVPRLGLVDRHVPGLAIFVTVLGFNLFGDGLRDASDPTLRGHSP